MFSSTTEDFITTPLSELLVEATDAMTAVEDGMKGYQIADWVMPTLFLRMTGAQEQKLKCIHWDLGSVDLDQRYRYYSNKMGEMSCYDDKSKVCGEMLNFIVCNKQDFNPQADINRQKLLEEAKEDVKRICGNSVMRAWYAADYNGFEEVVATFKYQDLVVWDEKKKKCTALLGGELRSAFDALYNHRNKCAHNSTSYQMNLSKFQVLSGPYAKYENYFIRFFLLIMLDRLFVLLYQKAVALADLN